MSEWQDVDRRFTRLERKWSVHDHPGVNRQLFQFATLTPREDAEVDREFASLGAAPISESLESEAGDLRAALAFPARGQSPDDPCDDVYQAALTMMPFGEWTASASLEKLYRGQRDARWAVVPSFFRGSDDERAADLAQVNGLADTAPRRWRTCRGSSAGHRAVPRRG